jgi:hypothetical protein
VVNPISREDADAIAKIILLHAKDFNGFLIDRQADRNAEALDTLRNLVGKLMAAQYFEVLEVVARQYPDIMDRLDDLQGE